MMKIKATKKQIIAGLQSEDITRQIDKMDLYSEFKVISLEDAKAGSQSPYKNPKTTIHVKTYVTSRGGTYGYQLLSCVWIKVDGEWYQASGSKTSGYGCDKISSAIGSAFRAVGVHNYIDGTGQHEEFIQLLAKKLLVRKPFIIV